MGEIVGGILLSSSSMTASAQNIFSLRSLLINDFPVNKVTQSSTMTFQSTIFSHEWRFRLLFGGRRFVLWEFSLDFPFDWKVLLLRMKNFRQEFLWLILREIKFNFASGRIYKFKRTNLITSCRNRSFNNCWQVEDARTINADKSYAEQIFVDFSPVNWLVSRWKRIID